MSKVFKNNIWGEILSISIILFLVIFPHLVPLPFYSYTIVCLVIVFFSLKKQGLSLRDLGVKRSGLNATTIFKGLGTAIIWVAFNQLIYIPAIKYFFEVPEYTEYNFIRDSAVTLIFIIIAACLVGGLYEEFIFRGFIQKSLEKFSKSFWIAAFITSLLFGVYHFQQGIFGVVPAILGGLYWSLLLRKDRENLWLPIFSHAVFDTITLLLIYYQLFGTINYN